MTITKPTALRSTLAALVVGSAGMFPAAAPSGGAGAATLTTTTTSWSPATIVDHVFTRDFELDHGALTITPVHGGAPRLSPTLAASMWATSGLGGHEVGLGFGVVTVDAARTSDPVGPRVTGLVRVAAFIGLTDLADQGYFCPLMRGPGSRVVPVSHGWQAVIFPLDPAKSDALFTASSNICGRVRPNVIDTAYLVLSVRWHLSSSGADVVVSVPACATMDSWGGGGGGYVNPQPITFQATVLVLERPLGHACSAPTTFDAGARFASPHTVHGPTGPVRQVRPAPTATSVSG